MSIGSSDVDFLASPNLSYGPNMLVIGNAKVICDFCSEPEKFSLLRLTQHHARLFMHDFLKP